VKLRAIHVLRVVFSEKKNLNNTYPYIRRRVIVFVHSFLVACVLRKKKPEKKTEKKITTIKKNPVRRDERTCVRACVVGPGLACGRPIFTHRIQLVNTKPRSVRGMPRMAKRIRTTYRSGARIACDARALRLVVGVAAAGERVQRSPRLIVLRAPTTAAAADADVAEQPVRTSSSPVFSVAGDRPHCATRPAAARDDARSPPPPLAAVDAR